MQFPLIPALLLALTAIPALAAVPKASMKIHPDFDPSKAVPVPSLESQRSSKRNSLASSAVLKRLSAQSLTLEQSKASQFDPATGRRHSVTCLIKPGVVPCRQCPCLDCTEYTTWYYTDEPAEMEFSCWTRGSKDGWSAGVEFYDKNYAGCWINEAYIEDNCWMNFNVCS